MLRINASSVECYTEFEEVLIVHFDDEANHYLQLQVPLEDFEEEAEGSMVHVEVDDQSNSGYDCIKAAELRRNSFRVFFDAEARIARSLSQIGDVEVTFGLGADEFGKLSVALTRVFRKLAAYRNIADDSRDSEH